MITGFERFHSIVSTAVEDAIKIGVPCRRKRIKRKKRITRMKYKRVDRAPCNSLLGT